MTASAVPLTAVRRGGTAMRWLSRIPYVVLAVYVAVAIIGPLVIDYNPVLTILDDRLLAPGSRVSSGGTAWLGTDGLGRDVLAARVLGVPRRSILVRHILPFTIGPVVALATLEFALVVLAEAGLSFLGIGLPNSAVSWGQTIANGKQYLATAWWISALPGFALSLLIINIGILGDQLTARYGRGQTGRLR